MSTHDHKRGQRCITHTANTRKIPVIAEVRKEQYYNQKNVTHTVGEAKTEEGVKTSCGTRLREIVSERSHSSIRKIGAGKTVSR